MQHHRPMAALFPSRVTPTFSCLPTSPVPKSQSPSGDSLKLCVLPKDQMPEDTQIKYLPDPATQDPDQTQTTQPVRTFRVSIKKSAGLWDLSEGEHQPQDKEQVAKLRPQAISKAMSYNKTSTQVSPSEIRKSQSTHDDDTVLKRITRPLSPLKNIQGCCSKNQYFDLISQNRRQIKRLSKQQEDNLNGTPVVGRRSCLNPFRELNIDEILCNPCRSAAPNAPAEIVPETNDQAGSPQYSKHDDDVFKD